MRKNLAEKLKESLQAVLPIGCIIMLLHFTIAPMPGGTLALMLVGMVMLIIGLTLFSLGTDLAMMPMGEHIGSALLKSRNLPLMVVVLLLFGTLVTAAEPDLSVLAVQVASIPRNRLIIGISVGVGVFLVLAALRILFRWKLARLLMLCYPLCFVLAIFSPDYLAVSFDASAVTTGPITVPFLLAIGSGFASISSNRDSEEDNFGLCALCSIGPIFAVLLMGLNSTMEGSDPLANSTPAVHNFVQLLGVFGKGLAHTFIEVLLVVLPILAVFMLFQFFKLKLPKRHLYKIFVGLAYLLVGLTVFLAGVNTGFMPAANFLGETMGALPYSWVLVPVSIVIGASVVLAEPAVHVLTKQVEEVTGGAITTRMMLTGMAMGVGLALCLGMLRIMFGIPVWYILIPGWLLALVLTYFVPSIFVGIGFDSGGVAAGAMSAAFVLPFTIGVCTAYGGNIIRDAFGVVGLIAMMPPMTVQVMGVVYKAKLRRAAMAEALAEAQDAAETEAEQNML